MATVSTDDASRRLEFVWLGQVENPWLIQARIKLWGLTIVLAVIFTATLALPLSMAVPVVPALILGGALGLCTAVVIAWRLAKHISAVTPIGYHLGIFGAELHSPRAPKAQEVEVAIPAGLFLETRPEHSQLMSLTAPSVGGDNTEAHQ